MGLFPGFCFPYINNIKTLYYTDKDGDEWE